jgi:hypothetical protein
VSWECNSEFAVDFWRRLATTVVHDARAEAGTDTRVYFEMAVLGVGA